MRYSGILFDFNGTMFFDTRQNEAAWQAFARKYCGRLITETEFRERAHGRTNRDLLEYLFDRRLSALEVESYSAEKEIIYRELCLQDAVNFHLAPGLTELLDELKAAGFPRNIATAAEKGNVDFYCRHFHLAQWFDLDKVVYDNGTFPGKPRPDIYLLAAQKIGLMPASCIVVEDALSGIQAAQAAGAGKIIAIGPAAGHRALRKINGVSAVISDFHELDRNFLREGSL